MKKQMFRRIMALVLVCSMVMSLVCTTTFAIGDVDDDGMETLEVMQTEEDAAVPEEENAGEGAAVPEEENAGEDAAAPEEETAAEQEETVSEPVEETADPAEAQAETDPVEGETLQSDSDTDLGWKPVTNANDTVSYQYWYKDANGDPVKAKDYFGDTDSNMANENAYNAYYISKSETIYQTDENGNEKVLADTPAGYYYFDANGNCVSKATWTLYTVTVIGENGQVISSDDTHSGYKCLKMNVAVGNVAAGKVIYYGQQVKAARAITAPNNNIYLAKVSNSGVYDSLSETKNPALYITYHADNAQYWYTFSAEKDDVGLLGELASGIHYVDISASPKYSGPVDSEKNGIKYCYQFKDGMPVSNLDGKRYTYKNPNNKTNYAVYFADSSTYGFSVGYYAKQGTAWTNFSGKSSKYYTVDSEGKTTLYSGFHKLNGYYNYFENGVTKKYTGWLAVRNTSYDSGSAKNIRDMSRAYRGITQSAYAYDFYYFKNSKQCVGKANKTVMAKAPAISAVNTKGKKIISTNDSKSYYYYFKSNGKLVQNLFTYNTAFKKKKMEIICDDKNTNHNATFLSYNSKTGKCDIAALQVILSTPSKPNGKSGLAHGKYYLSIYSRRSWLQNKSKTMWFCYLTYLNTTSKKATGFFFHSPSYSKQSLKALNSAYNKFGRSNTGGCLRLQTGFCQLVYSISQSQTKRYQVTVKFGSYSNVSPFMRVKQKMIQIDLKKFKYDPTTTEKVLKDKKII